MASKEMFASAGTEEKKGFIRTALKIAAIAVGALIVINLLARL